MAKEITILGSKKVYEGRIIQVTRDHVLLPDQHEVDWETVNHPGAAAVVALDTQNRLCLVKQYRHSIKKWIWELPAGRLEPGEAPASTARRELQEEVGVDAEQWVGLGAIFTSPGIFDEIIHLYLAKGIIPAKQALEVGELLEVHWIQLGQALDWCNEGTIEDGKTLAGIYRAHALLQSEQNNINNEHGC